jgi:hypothetical protein
VNDLDRLASFLIEGSAFGNQQNLTTRMHVPIQLCTGIARCDSNAGLERTVTHTQLVEPDVPRVVLCSG